MEVEAGSLSPGAHWYWDGNDWIPAVSPDGWWRWDGSRWVEREVVSQGTSASRWNRTDQLRLIAATLIIPVVLTAIIGVLLWIGTDNPAWWATSLGIGLAVCGIGAGLGVRARAEWPEALLLALIIATAISAYSGAVGVVATDMTTSCNRQSPSPRYRSECDTTGYGIGAAAIGASCFVFLVPFTLAGRALSRRRNAQTSSLVGTPTRP